MTAARTGTRGGAQRGAADLVHGESRGKTAPARFDRRGPLEVLVWPALAELGVDAVVTTRSGGVSVGPYESLNLALHVGDDPVAVVENRRRAAAALGAMLDDLVFGVQVHGIGASVVTGAHRGRGTLGPGDALAETDALVTTDPGTVLVTLVADCVPVVLFDPGARVLACAHAGWRGALSGVLDQTIAAMRTLGASTNRLVAGIGPGVAADRYQVGPEVRQAALAALGADGPALVPPDGTGRWLLDLPGTVRCLLGRAGIDASRLLEAPFSTGGPFFSDRAERPCGRFGLLARIAP
jgi:polyphenol oxidase